MQAARLQRDQCTSQLATHCWPPRPATAATVSRSAEQPLAAIARALAALQRQRSEAFHERRCQGCLRCAAHVEILTVRISRPTGDESPCHPPHLCGAAPCRGKAATWARLSACVLDRGQPQVAPLPPRSRARSLGASLGSAMRGAEHDAGNRLIDAALRPTRRPAAVRNQGSAQAAPSAACRGPRWVGAREAHTRGTIRKRRVAEGGARLGAQAGRAAQLSASAEIKKRRRGGAAPP